MYPNKKTVSCDFGGRPITIETGRLAKQASGSVLVTYGETVVLVTAVCNKKPKPGQSFFPLTVDYLEKYYAAGKFPGGFFKRESRPSTDATLTARLIDRPLRPLFPEGFLCDTQVVAQVLSVDKENDPDIAASLGASAALTISSSPSSKEGFAKTSSEASSAIISAAISAIKFCFSFFDIERNALFALLTVCSLDLFPQPAIKRQRQNIETYFMAISLNELIFLMEKDNVGPAKLQKRPPVKTRSLFIFTIPKN